MNARNFLLLTFDGGSFACLCDIMFSQKIFLTDNMVILIILNLQKIIVNNQPLNLCAKISDIIDSPA